MEISFITSLEVVIVAKVESPFQHVMSRRSRVFGPPGTGVGVKPFATSPLKSSPLATPPVSADGSGSGSNSREDSQNLHLSGVKSPLVGSLLSSPKRVDSPPSSSELSLSESVSSSITSDDTTIVPEPAFDKHARASGGSSLPVSVPGSAPALNDVNGFRDGPSGELGFESVINSGYGLSGADAGAGSGSGSSHGHSGSSNMDIGDQLHDISSLAASGSGFSGLDGDGIKELVVPSSFDLATSSDDVPSLIVTDSGVGSEVGSGTGSAVPDLMCPICGDSMVSLLQLNRHLDDAHSETVTPTENEQLKGWFRKKVEQAKQIQQLQTVTSVFSQSLNLNLFDDSGSDRSVVVGSGTSSGAGVGAGTGSGGNASGSSTPRRNVQDKSEAVTRKHWKNHGTGPAGRDKCSYPTCDKLLVSRNGAIHCRQCGQLFCREHSMYQMKLAPQTARHDPTSGSSVWCRVCQTCYESRPGYNDHSGTVHDLSAYFLQVRQKQVDINELEVNRLEKRLIRLIRALADLGEGLFTYTTSIRRKSIEHHVAVWQNDKDVHNCPICSQKFGYSLRKHHCRVCGQVVCADLGTDCSRDVPISVLSNKLDNGTNQLPRRDDIGIRICRDCKRTIFAKRNFEAEGQADRPDMLKIYDSMAHIKHSIDISLPKFQDMLMKLNDPENPPPHQVLDEAATVRRKLLQSFSQYDSMARKVLTADALRETDKRLQKQIYQVAAQYLQENMLPLKALPRALKHNKAAAAAVASTEVSSSNSSISENMDPSSTSTPVPPTPLLSDDEIQSYREQLIVMEEQKFMVENMISESKTHRRFNEVAPLEENLRDLEQEVSRIKSVLGSYVIT
ncbi:Pep7p [Sugiyamaella lignohabitans]|uniref:Pep7p n=1 Tax=Sugiyamaella lignohabitans TaxID=796027 RepID=A0A167F882_9ASCO|nr:Pep7p [Sugiyamaella lignohabitans]ANB14941.1 Pep7p [Sugiyamaella lignohabitans]